MNARSDNQNRNEYEESPGGPRPDGNLTFLDCYKARKNLVQFPDRESAPEVRIALIGSYTLDPLAVCLEVRAREAGFRPVIFQGGYNLYHQELLDPASPLPQFQPDLVILALDTETSFGDTIYHLDPDRAGEKDKKIQAAVEELTGAIESFLARSEKSTILVNNFPLPRRSALGILKSKDPGDISFLLQRANDTLRDHFVKEPRVFVFDLEGCLAEYGKGRAADPRLKYIAKIPYAHDFFPVLASRYVAYIRAIFGAPKKVLVLDLDNTLWGGIVGEAGFNGIDLGESPAGEAFVDFQKRILELHNRGVVLAINSKNNYEDAIKVLREHPRMVLREEMFSAVQINWRDKVANMREIAENLNLGLDSFVFLDDSPVERGYVAAALPRVAVPALPEDPLLYPQFIENLTLFEQAALTTEDRDKTRLYRQRQQAEELRDETDSLETYLAKLKMTAKVKETDAFSLPRVHQLFAKTNQFNLTTKRYTLPELQQFMDNPDCRLWDLELSDRFGNNGIVAAALIKFEGRQSAVIDSFLMSCRVIGRFAEDYFLSVITDDAWRRGVKKLAGLYSPTEKNAPAREFYPRLGFQPITTDNNLTRYELDLGNNPLAAPEWIKPAENDGDKPPDEPGRKA